MKKSEFGVIALLGLLLIGTISSHTVCATKTIGVSYPNYDRVEIQPDSTISGTFTTFNQGDEDLTCYAEIRNAPGEAFIEWRLPNGEWIKTPETFIPIKEHRYARFTLYLKELVKGAWYNWSIVVGYIDYDPSTHAVAANGIAIHMIWPRPIPWYEKVPWAMISTFIVVAFVGSYFGKRIWKGIKGMAPQLETQNVEKKHTHKRATKRKAITRLGNDHD